MGALRKDNVAEELVGYNKRARGLRAGRVRLTVGAEGGLPDEARRGPEGACVVT